VVPYEWLGLHPKVATAHVDAGADVLMLMLLFSRTARSELFPLAGGQQQEERFPTDILACYLT